jgi:4-hydroxyacetophenone monooxygenase
MRLDFPRDPLTDDDETIRARVVGVPIAPLLAAVAHLTGDLALLRNDLRPDLAKVMLFDDGYSSEQVEQARRLAADALIRFRDGGCHAAPAPGREHLRALVEFVTGGALDDEHLTLFEEELALGGADLRAPAWHAAEAAPGRPFTVAIIGAGMSGIVVAHRLRQAGIDVRIFEKNADVGGTWLENDYPGCRVDVPNHFYSYSFAQSRHWPQFYSTQPVLLDYFRTCVDKLTLGDAISFETEVLEARWNDDRQIWALRIRDASGVERIHEAHAVVSAVGQLNRPLMPDIEGIDTFRGPSFHSARWESGVDITAKRVAVIGTGASAIQFIPWLAERVGHLTVHQRTPPWLVPAPNYQDDLPPNLQWLLRHVPEYARWDRLSVLARLQEGSLPQTTVDPSWDASVGSVSAANDMVRAGLTAYYETAFPDPELRAKVLPSYPFGAKRMVVDNGLYSETLRRSNVTLDTASIAAITPTGVHMRDGRDLDYDVIIYGTGFQASKFLTPMRVIGANGTDLHKRWGGDARAYLGITVPSFPNLFLMYGPNTNVVVNGSIIFFSECEAHYIAESVGMLLERGARSMDCRPEVHDAYNERIDNATGVRQIYGSVAKRQRVGASVRPSDC